MRIVKSQSIRGNADRSYSRTLTPPRRVLGYISANHSRAIVSPIDTPRVRIANTYDRS